MDEHIIDIHDYGQFVELDIESQELINNKPIPPSPNTSLMNELNRPSFIRSIYLIFMCIMKQIHDL